MTVLVIAHVASAGIGVLGLPIWAVAYLVAATLGVAALVARASLAASKPRPRDRAREINPAAASVIRRILAATGIGGAVVVGALLVLAAVIALAGPTQYGSNAAPSLVFSIFWIGGAWLAFALGDVWWRIDPFLAVGRIRDRLRDRQRQQPTTGAPGAPGSATTASPAERRWWTTPLVLATFLILWTADPIGIEPRRMAVWLVGFTVVASLGAIVGGARAAADLNPFPAVFGFAAQLRRRRATPETPSWTSGAVAAIDSRAVLALASLVAAASLFDRLKGTKFFLESVPSRTQTVAWLENVAVVAWLAACIAALWWGVGAFAWRTLHLDATTEGTADHESGLEGDAAGDGPGADDRANARPGLLLASSLGPIAAGITLTHGVFSLLVQVQNVVVLLSDPFARGQDLFGTINWHVAQPFSTRTETMIQLPIIVLAHIAAIWLVRDEIRSAALQATEGRPKKAARLRSVRAALPAFALITASGVASTLFLLGI